MTRYVYFAASKNPRCTDIKIGISINPEKRMMGIKGRLILAIPCERKFSRKLESALHKSFENWRYDGTEWFASNAPLLQLIRGAMLLGYWPWDKTPIVRGEWV